MNDPEGTLERVVQDAMRLTPAEQLRLIERLASALERELSPLPSLSEDPLYGLLAEYGPAPSAEEIDELRREAWAGFPHDDAG